MNRLWARLSKPHVMTAVVTLTLTLAIAFVYSGSFNNSITNWDDREFFLESSAIRDFNLRSIFLEQRGGNYYPITVLSMAMDYWMGDGEPFVAHFASGVFHLLNSLLLFLFLFRCCSMIADRASPTEISSSLSFSPHSHPFNRGSRNESTDPYRIKAWFLSFAAALLFAIHPMNVEVVSWISARNHLVGTFFQLLSMIFYLQFLKTERRRWQILSFIFFLLALLSKSGTFITPLLFVTVDLLVKKSTNSSWRESRFWLDQLKGKFIYLIPATAIVLITLGFRGTTEAPVPEIFQMPFGERMAWALKGLIFYISRGLVPRHLSAYYDIRQVNVDFWDWGLASIFLFVCIHHRHNRFVPFAFLWFLIPTLPILKLIPFGEYSIFNDRYFYLSGMGLFMIIFSVVTMYTERLWAKITEVKPPFTAAMAPQHKTNSTPNQLRKRQTRVHFSQYHSPWPAIGVQLCLLCGLYFYYAPQAQQRTSTWKDGETLWRDVLKTYPGTSMAWNNLGRIYLERGDLNLAKDAFESALKDRPGLALAYYNLAYSFYRLNLKQEALKILEDMLLRWPNDPNGRGLNEVIKNQMTGQ